MKSLLVTNQTLQFQFVEGAEALRQRLEHRLRLHWGGWFLDEEAGFPIYEILGQKSPDLEIVRQVVRGALLEDEEVLSVDRVEVRLEGRSLHVEFSATTEYGVVQGGVA